MDIDTLHEIDLHTYQMGIDIASYAGNAFLDDNAEQMEFFKGFHRALVLMRKYTEEKRKPLLLKEYKEEEKKTFSEHFQEQTATLKDYDHNVFTNVVWGLVKEGWKHRGGSKTYALLDKDDSAIKVFRDTDAPAVIKICFSAEPEKKDSWPKVAKCPECGHLTDVTGIDSETIKVCCCCRHEWKYQPAEEVKVEEKTENTS